MWTKRAVVLHKGIFKEQATLGEAVFVITGMTIGAGILGLPYAVRQVGLLMGLGYIVGIGLIILCLNTMIGEVAIRTKQELQLPGFAEKYLGKWARNILSLTLLSGSFGALLVYIIGEGQSLAAIFGGTPIIWSIIFWSLGSFFIVAGLQRIKVIEKFFGIAIMMIITGLSFFLLRHFHTSELYYINSSKLFFPLGVILFAFHASPAVAEAHALLPNAPEKFRRSLIIGTLVPIIVYALFSLAVVGFIGKDTTEIATIGLGKALGPLVIILANLFAVLAMSTSFMGLGTALKEILTWDHKMPERSAAFLVISLPLILFLLGARSFIQILSLIGGLFIAVEGIIMVGVYFRVRQIGDMPFRESNSARFSKIIAFPVGGFFLWLLGFSVYNFFIR